MRFDDIKIELEKHASLDVIAESVEDPTQQTTTAYSNEGDNDPYAEDKF